MVELIYKYRVWEDFYQRKSINNNELYFASPKSLNDPKELSNILHFELLEYTDMIEFAYRVIKQVEPWLTKEDQYQKAKIWVDEDSNNGYRELLKHGKKITERFRKMVGIYSAAKTNTNNHLWKNYANNYKGFAIGYDYLELREYLSSKKFSNFGGEVKYVSEYPQLIPNIEDRMSDIFKICLTKLSIWKSEDELRILKFLWVNRKWSIRSSIIKEIIIGQDMNSGSKEALLKFVKAKYHNAKVYIANKPLDDSDKATITNYR